MFQAKTMENTTCCFLVQIVEWLYISDTWNILEWWSQQMLSGDRLKSPHAACIWMENDGRTLGFPIAPQIELKRCQDVLWPRPTLAQYHGQGPVCHGFYYGPLGNKTWQWNIDTWSIWQNQCISVYILCISYVIYYIYNILIRYQTSHVIMCIRLYK